MLVLFKEYARFIKAFTFDYINIGNFLIAVFILITEILWLNEAEIAIQNNLLTSLKMLIPFSPLVVET